MPVLSDGRQRRCVLARRGVLELEGDDEQADAGGESLHRAVRWRRVGAEKRRGVGARRRERWRRTSPPSGRCDRQPAAHELTSVRRESSRIHDSRIGTPMDFRLTADQELLRRSVREFAETEIRPHVREWDQAQQFPADAGPAARRARADGHPVSGGVRRRRHVRDRLLHLHRRAGPRRSGGRAVGGGPQRTLRRAHFSGREPKSRSSGFWSRSRAARRSARGR